MQVLKEHQGCPEAWPITSAQIKRPCCMNHGLADVAGVTIETKAGKARGETAGVWADVTALPSADDGVQVDARAVRHAAQLWAQVAGEAQFESASGRAAVLVWRHPPMRGRWGGEGMSNGRPQSSAGGLHARNSGKARLGAQVKPAAPWASSEQKHSLRRSQPGESL